MTYEIVYGIAVVVLSVGAAVLARQRRPVYLVVRRHRPDGSRVR